MATVGGLRAALARDSERRSGGCANGLPRAPPAHIERVPCARTGRAVARPRRERFERGDRAVLGPHRRSPSGPRGGRCLARIAPRPIGAPGPPERVARSGLGGAQLGRPRDPDARLDRALDTANRPRSARRAEGQCSVLRRRRDAGDERPDRARDARASARHRSLAGRGDGRRGHRSRGRARGRGSARALASPAHGLLPRQLHRAHREPVRRDARGRIGHREHVPGSRHAGDPPGGRHRTRGDR